MKGWLGETVTDNMTKSASRSGREHDAMSATKLSKHQESVSCEITRVWCVQNSVTFENATT